MKQANCITFCYATETALKLDSLIGDVEDAVSSSVTTKLRSPPNSVASEVSVFYTNQAK